MQTCLNGNFNENVPKPSAAKEGSRTMVRVPLVASEVLQGGTRATYLGLLEIKQNKATLTKRIF